MHAQNFFSSYFTTIKIYCAVKQVANAIHWTKEWIQAMLSASAQVSSEKFIYKDCYQKIPTWVTEHTQPDKQKKSYGFAVLEKTLENIFCLVLVHGIPSAQISIPPLKLNKQRVFTNNIILWSTVSYFHLILGPRSRTLFKEDYQTRNSKVSSLWYYVSMFARSWKSIRIILNSNGTEMKLFKCSMKWYYVSISPYSSWVKVHSFV